MEGEISIMESNIKLFLLTESSNNPLGHYLGHRKFFVYQLFSILFSIWFTYYHDITDLSKTHFTHFLVQ